MPVLRGEDHPNAKLKEYQVAVIKGAFQAGVSTQWLADQYGVTYATIGNIGHGGGWTHVEPVAWPQDDD